MILWPCIFKLEGDSELIYLDSERHLKTELDDLIWYKTDWLIDSNGHCFTILAKGGEYIFEAEEKRFSLAAVTQLIQEHEFAKAEMCLTKIQFSSIQQAIESLSQEL
ncbi:DUF4144 domain-containing protein [Vibrio ishigakensis]|uniref:DUF4144 domain-containing protein n=1 Tax=Vibrio ishigakensis TaxID=1481914 RepID=UPI0021C2767A|nr:DUF4144 domain-containing protein [Vibrio ishigakensis]